MFSEGGGRYIDYPEGLEFTESGETEVSSEARDSTSVDDGLGQREVGLQVLGTEEASSLSLRARFELGHLDLDGTLDLRYVVLDFGDPRFVGPVPSILTSVRRYKWIRTPSFPPEAS